MMKEKPDSPGLWTREGTQYVVRCKGKFTAQDWGILEAATVAPSGWFDSLFWEVDSLPTGNWQKLGATAGEADKQFRDWLTQSKHCPCGVHRCMEIADKAAELFAGVPRLEEVDRLVKLVGDIYQVTGHIYGGNELESAKKMAKELREAESQITTLKQTIARLDEEIAELNQKVERRTNELDAHVKYHEHCRNKIDKALGEPRYDDCDIWAAYVRRIAELKDFTPVAPQPEVIEGRGQAVTEEQVGMYWAEGSAGTTMFMQIKAHTVFAPNCRYIKIIPPTFPPKPAFVAPEKPELVLVRYAGGICWASRDGIWFRTLGGTPMSVGLCEVLNPDTGEVIQ